MLRLHSLVWVLIIVTYLGIICFRCYQDKMFGARAIQRRRDKEAELKVGDKTSHACSRVAERIAMDRTNKIARAAAFLFLPSSISTTYLPLMEDEMAVFSLNPATWSAVKPPTHPDKYRETS